MDAPLEAPSPAPSALARVAARIHGSRFAWRVGGTYATRVALVGVGVASAVVVNRALGPGGRGDYAAAAALGALGVQLLNLGLPAATTRAVAQDRAALPALVGNGAAAAVLVGGGGVALAAAIFTGWPSLAPVHGGLLWLAGGFVPIALAYAVLQASMLGLERVRALNGVEIAHRLLGLAGVATLAVAGAATPEACFAVGLATLAVCGVWMGRACIVAGGGPPRPSWVRFQTHIRFGLKAWMIGMLAFAVYRVDVLLLHHFRGATETGQYSVAATLAEQVLAFPSVAATLLLPKLAGIADPLRRRRVARGAILAVAAAMVPLAGAAALLAPLAVRWLFGPSFAPSVEPFWLLLPGCCAFGVQAIASQYLAALGLPKAHVGLWALLAVLNVAANLVAIPGWGAHGAAAVFSGTGVLACLGTLWLARRQR